MPSAGSPTTTRSSISAWSSSATTKPPREVRLGNLDIAIDQRYRHVPHRRHDELREHGAARRTALSSRCLRLPHQETPASEPSLWVGPSPDSDCGKAAESICRAAGFEPKLKFESDDFGVALQLVEAMGAVAILPELALFRAAPILRWIKVDGTRQIVSLTRREGEKAQPQWRPSPHICNRQPIAISKSSGRHNAASRPECANLSPSCRRDLERRSSPRSSPTSASRSPSSSDSS